MKLEDRLEKRLLEWRKLANAYRDAQHDREPSEDEWLLNRELAELIERCISELAADMTFGILNRLRRRQSQLAPKACRP